MRGPEVDRQRLLLLEGDRHNIDELRDLLTGQGYDCEVALDVRTARSILEDRLMYMAVVNAGMPGVSDHDVVKDFKECQPRILLVIYNGTRNKSRQSKVRRAGADSYLGKGSDLKAVARAVLRVLEAAATPKPAPRRRRSVRRGRRAGKAAQTRRRSRG